MTSHTAVTAHDITQHTAWRSTWRKN